MKGEGNGKERKAGGLMHRNREKERMVERTRHAERRYRHGRREREGKEKGEKERVKGTIEFNCKRRREGAWNKENTKLRDGRIEIDKEK